MIARKGLTGEAVKRHISAIIPIISRDSEETDETAESGPCQVRRQQPPRAAKNTAAGNMRDMD